MSMRNLKEVEDPKHFLIHDKLWKKSLDNRGKYSNLLTNLSMALVIFLKDYIV